MGLRKRKPTSPGSRHAVLNDFAEITTDKPEKSLLRPKHKKGGRNNSGKRTVRHHGGGHKRHYRVIDFKRNKDGIPGRVASIEYDPNRSSFIALIVYVDGEKRYILAPAGLGKGDTVLSGADVEVKAGNSLPLEKMPTGTQLHNVELAPGEGGKLIRGAGTWGTLTAKEGKHAHVTLPSGEVRRFLLQCRATVGQIGNSEHKNIVYGKAGRKRWLGVRPTVRGSAQNPVSHPMGGGEGRRAGGRHPMSPWGWATKGKKTRRRRKPSNSLIVRRAKGKKIG